MSVVVSLVVTSMTAFAQNTGKPEYPRYGFWSNWSIGGSLDLNHELNQGYPIFGSGWRQNANIGMDIFAQQKLNHVFDWRLRFGFPSFGEPKGTVSDNTGFKLNRNFSLTLDVLFSLNDALMGYDPDRKWSFYFFGGAGARFNGLSKDEYTTTANTKPNHAEDKKREIEGENKGIAQVMVTFGQGFRYNLSESHTVFAEYSFDIADIVNIFDAKFYNGWHDINSIFRLGYAYNFGVTAADQAIAAQKNMLTQENFGAMNTQVNNLETQVAAAKNKEKKLEKRISELEQQLANAQTRPSNGASNSELQSVIDQIKADQLTFYAMPFSVQYDVNQWEVSEAEMDKVKAVARVLKDNPDVKITVVGFADYTGSDQYNMKLSEKRANEVKRLLTKKYGIAESRISTDYKGKSVAFGDIQYSLNRRVSFYRVIE